MESSNVPAEAPTDASTSESAVSAASEADGQSKALPNPGSEAYEDLLERAAEDVHTALAEIIQEADEDYDRAKRLLDRVLTIVHEKL